MFEKSGCDQNHPQFQLLAHEPGQRRNVNYLAEANLRIWGFH